MLKGKIEIYSTKKGIIAIESPIKNKILQKLQEKERTFEGLIEVCGKSKSTTAVHLNDLLKIGIIYKRNDPNDRRKKFFGINTDLLVSSSVPVNGHYNKILQAMPASVGDKYSFLRSVFHLVRSGMESYGVDTSPVMKKIGKDIGRTVAPMFKSDTMQELLVELPRFWAEQGLGKISIVNGNVPTIIINDCFDCSTMPDIGRTQCSLDEGMMEAILEERLHIQCSIREIECHGTGHHHCKFIIKIF